MADCNAKIADSMAGVLQDVVSFKMHPLIKVHGSSSHPNPLTPPEYDVFKLADYRFAAIFNPRALMYNMLMLQLMSVHLNTSLTVQDIMQLQTLSHLTHVGMDILPCQTALEVLCSTLAVSKLDLGTEPRTYNHDAAYSQHVVEALAQSRLGASLRDLSLPCHAAAIGGLAPLTGVTALHIHTQESDSFAGLTCLTHLLSLHIKLGYERRATEAPPSWEVFSVLSALTRLTCLCLHDRSTEGFPYDLNYACSFEHSWMSSLSALTSLCTFQFCHLRKPTGLEQGAYGRSHIPSDLLVLC